jgi:putative solute:sodium symporter small subunit
MAKLFRHSRKSGKTPNRALTREPLRKHNDAKTRGRAEPAGMPKLSEEVPFCRAYRRPGVPCLDATSRASRPGSRHKTPQINEEQSPMTPENRAAYWKANLSLLSILLVIWFVVSYGFGILLVDVFNTISIGGYKLGFWFAQQGSMYIFIVLIFFYAWRMNALDKKFSVDE